MAQVVRTVFVEDPVRDRLRQKIGIGNLPDFNRSKKERVSLPDLREATQVYKLADEELKCYCNCKLGIENCKAVRFICFIF
jgi:hypothetical protein